MSFDCRLLKSDLAPRNRPDSKDSNVVCEADPVIHSLHLSRRYRMLETAHPPVRDPGHPAILMACIVVSSLGQLPNSDSCQGSRRFVVGNHGTQGHPSKVTTGQLGYFTKTDGN